MPGICGALRVDKEEYSSLWKEFSQPWTDCKFMSFPGGFLGGHAFGSASAIRTLNEYYYLAVDGEASIYSSVPTREEVTGPFWTSLESLDPVAACKGNVVAVDLHSRLCYLKAEQTGTFPLYYALTSGGQLLFSSRLKPLSRAINASPDLAGVLEFISTRHTFYRRTHYQRIFRLLPGQTITYQLDSGQLTVREPRITWIGNREGRHEDLDCETLWGGLKTVVRKGFDSEKRHALMMSAGWDSRLLLCAMMKELGNDRIVAYTWGDPYSRELKVVNQMCRSAGVECILEPLDDTLYEPAFLQKAFDRVENVLFPQWHRASEQLSEIGVQSVASGVYGEVLGGHYGPAMTLTGMRKAIVVAAALIGIPVQFDTFEHLRFPSVAKKPWYLTKTAWADLLDASQDRDCDIESVWRDLEKLDTKISEQLIEAFMALTRGSRYINQQILSCRTGLDVALPFIDLDLLKLASQIPQCSKIHNTLNRKLLQRHGSSLLRFTTGATLVPAFMPILLQEASRVIRNVQDNIFEKLNGMTKGSIRPSRSDFFGLDFLRNGRAFRRILDDLRSDMWDRDTIELAIKDVAGYSQANNRRISYMSYNFLTMYTTDLMLR